MIKYIIWALVTVIVIIACAIFGVDILFYIKNEIFEKYHIGRWETNESWHNAVKSTAKKWALKTPTVRITDSERYVLWDIFNRKYRSQSIQSWQTASLVLALNTINEKDTSQRVISKYINSKGDWINNPIGVDFGLLSYSFMKTIEDEYRIKPAMDFMLNKILSFKDDSDLICYNKDNTNPEKYVDTLGFVCPFLTCYARIYNKPEYEKLAIKQLEFFHNFGLYNNLPNHAINSITKEPLGVYGWGRGVAWYLIGLLGTYIECQNEIEKQVLFVWIKETADSYLIYQKDDGGFGSTLQRKTTYDSSATTFLAYYYAYCYKLFGEEKYKNVSQKCLKKLKTVTRRNGALDCCQGDTKDIGIFAQYYDIMPFAQGYLVRAIELLKG